MNPPQMRMIKRPGIWIPVFFLCFVPGAGQSPWKGLPFPAHGGSLAASGGYGSVVQNQAGLGWAMDHSLTILHTRPYLLRELGISSICGQFQTGRGGVGVSFSTLGIPGFRYSEGWVSCGLQIHEVLCAGLGIHFWNTGTAERILHHPGISFALGVQAHASDRLALGAHVFHPAGWPPGPSQTGTGEMMVTAGGAWTLYGDISLYGDLQFTPDGLPVLHHGVALEMDGRILIFNSYIYRPFSISGGIRFILGPLTIHAAFSYRLDAGSTPFSSITYAW